MASARASRFGLGLRLRLGLGAKLGLLLLEKVRDLLALRRHRRSRLGLRFGPLAAARLRTDRRHGRRRRDRDLDRLLGDLDLGGPGRRRRNVALRLARIALFADLGDAVGPGLRLGLRRLGVRLAAGDLGELVVGQDLDRDAFLGLREGLGRDAEHEPGEERRVDGARHPEPRFGSIELQPHRLSLRNARASIRG